MLRPNQLDVDRAFVLVIDLQEKLLPLVRHHDAIIRATRQLLDTVRIFELPVLATEQNPRGIGQTVPGVRACMQASGAAVLEKMTFSAWAEPAVRDAILSLDRPQVVMVGIEAHVCIQQTALDMQSRDYDVFVCGDGVGSRSRIDYELSLDRMRQEGVWVTTVESVLFELCNRCDTSRFKAMLEIIKKTPPDRIDGI